VLIAGHALFALSGVLLGDQMTTPPQALPLVSADAAAPAEEAGPTAA